MSSTITWARGTEVGQRYVVEGVLGQGAKSIVYRALDKVTNEEVALKALDATLFQDAVLFKRFTREMDLLRLLNHGNVARVQHTIEQDGRFCLVMELAPGRTLREIIDTDGPVSLEAFYQIATGLVAALDECHRKKVLHKRLSPSKIIVDTGFVPRIVDFGLWAAVPGVEGGGGVVGNASRHAGGTDVTRDSTRDSTREHSREGGVSPLLSTLDYRAPEQFFSKIVDVRSDVYALGVIFYEMLTGVRPFQGETQADLMSRQLRGDLRPLTSYRKDVPTALEDLIRKCLNYGLGGRFQSCYEVYRALRSVMKRGSSSRGVLSQQTTCSKCDEAQIPGLPFCHSCGRLKAESLQPGRWSLLASGCSDEAGLKRLFVSQYGFQDKELASVGTSRSFAVVHGLSASNAEDLRLKVQPFVDRAWVREKPQVDKAFVAKASLALLIAWGATGFALQSAGLLTKVPVDIGAFVGVFALVGAGTVSQFWFTLRASVVPEVRHERSSDRRRRERIEKMRDEILSFKNLDMREILGGLCASFGALEGAGDKAVSQKELTDLRDQTLNCARVLEAYDSFFSARKGVDFVRLISSLDAEIAGASSRSTPKEKARLCEKRTALQTEFNQMQVIEEDATRLRLVLLNTHAFLRKLYDFQRGKTNFKSGKTLVEECSMLLLESKSAEQELEVGKSFFSSNFESDFRFSVVADIARKVRFKKGDARSLTTPKMHGRGGVKRAANGQTTEDENTSGTQTSDRPTREAS